MDTSTEGQASRLNELLRTYPSGGKGLAAAIGVSEGTVARWRRARTSLGWERATQVAEVLGVTPGFLYAGLEGWVPPHAAKGRDDVPWNERHVPASPPAGVAPSGHASPPTREKLLELKVDELATRLTRVEARLDAMGAESRHPEAGGSAGVE